MKSEPVDVVTADLADISETEVKSRQRGPRRAAAVRKSAGPGQVADVSSRPANRPPLVKHRHVVTDKRKREAGHLAGIGVPESLIAARFKISLPTLKKYYHVDMVEGRASKTAVVAKRAYRQASSVDASPRSTQYWLNAQAGWRETDNKDAAVAGNVVIHIHSGIQRPGDDDSGMINVTPNGTPDTE